jgi:hypothetical protein
MDASSALVAELFADSLRFDSKVRIQAVLTDLSSAKENRKRVISSAPPPPRHLQNAISILTAALKNNFRDDFETQSKILAAMVRATTILITNHSFLC